MREKILKKIAQWHALYPWRMLITIVFLTIIFAGLAAQLSVTMRWSDLLPSGDRRTIEFNKIIDEFVTATSIIVVVQGEESRMKQFADELAPRMLAAIDTSKNAINKKKIARINAKIEQLKGQGKKKIAALQAEIKQLEERINKKLIQRVDYQTETNFLKDHGLLLLKEKDLKNLKEIYTDPTLTGLLVNINNSMEKEYVGQEESISTREKEDQAVVFLDGIKNMARLMKKSLQDEQIGEDESRQAADKLLLGDPYFLSYDKKALILNAIPNFTMLDMDLLITGAETIQAIVDDLLKDYPDLNAGLTGFIPIERDEMVYSQQSLNYTSLIAFIAILILLIISFRMVVAPLFAMITLAVGVLWAIGTAAAVVGQLNIMTQMTALILLGLGIDFSIHIISGFTEWRAAGDSIAVAMEKTFLKSGIGIITGALTTSFAFFTLVISSSRGMKELGLVAGSGLLAILLATLLFLPNLLVFRERLLERKYSKGSSKKSHVQRDISFRFLGNRAQWLANHHVFTLLTAIIVTILLIWSGSNITFDQNYMNIEPEGLTSIALQDTVLNKFDRSMDYAMILTNHVDESRNLAKKYRDMGSVAAVEDISMYLPSPVEQQGRIPHIREIRTTMEKSRIHPFIPNHQIASLRREIHRLQMNIMEMQDMAFLGGQDKVDNKCKEIVGSPNQPDSQNLLAELENILKVDTRNAAGQLSKLQRYFAPYYKSAVLRMCSTTPISLDQLPASILDRYSNKTRDKFLITVFPSGSIWTDANFLNRFADDMESVSNNATGMPVVFRALLQIIGHDGRNALILTLVIIFLLLWADFRSIQDALLAMVPLAAGIFWMLGLMHLTGQQLTVMNVMGLPMILGIGIDNGVHIIHRWRQEGHGNIYAVFASTGKAILLTSLTTMLAFGSMIFAIWRGFGQLGGALFLGVGACFLTTVIILSGIMGIIERKKWRKS